ncbi:MAG: hypothetical protein AABW92_02135 [Nanoarchaeota archaeon]
MKIHEKALTISTSSTIVLIAVLTIWSELSTPFKIWLTGIAGHHWVTKGVFSLVFFVITYFVFSKFSEDNVKKETSCVVVSAILSGLAIFLFYIWHFFSG